MTNREYLAMLSNEELSNTIYDVIVERVGRRYNSSRLGVAQWLGEEYAEHDFLSVAEILSRTNSGVNKRGRWLFSMEGVVCSVCGAKALNVTGLPSECKVCGAKMY